MTREEAIRALLKFLDWVDFLSGEIGGSADSTLHKAINLAIAALREQEERRSTYHDQFQQRRYTMARECFADAGITSESLKTMYSQGDFEQGGR